MMNKRDVIDIVVGCAGWVAVIVLVILTCCGILDFDMVFSIFCRIITFLGIVLIFLLLLRLALIMLDCAER